VDRRVAGDDVVVAPATAVVMPVGPNDEALDSVRSVLHFIAAPRAIVLVDDTQGRVDLAAAAALSDDVEVLPAPANAAGGQGGLWVKLAAGYRRALERCPFDVLLRMDADALVIGPGVETAARQRFGADPQLGMLGSYRIGPDGGVRDWTPAARILRRESGVRGRLRDPRLRTLLLRLRARADAHGYEAGEHPLGGAYLHSRAAVDALQANGWLDLPLLARSRLGEDHLFSLLTVAAGFRIADFGGPGDPLALRWRGLPAHPSQLLADGKLVTHSVRFFGDLDEAAIRRLFAAARH
jgi:hypothetical protein